MRAHPAALEPLGLVDLFIPAALPFVLSILSILVPRPLNRRSTHDSGIQGQHGAPPAATNAAAARRSPRVRGRFKPARMRVANNRAGDRENDCREDCENLCENF
jgi:hypothetical protein